MKIPDNRPTKTELNDFRTVIAMARASYNNDDGTELKLLQSLIKNPVNHIYALRALVECALAEMDGEKRSADEFMQFMVEQSAMSETKD